MREMTVYLPTNRRPGLAEHERIRNMLYLVYRERHSQCEMVVDFDWPKANGEPQSILN
jgi:hypothetical protein